MSDAGGNWQPHPDAITNRPVLPPVEPEEVVGVGAICDLGPNRPAEARSVSFSVGEFVRLANGRRVTLHSDRGFTLGWASSSAAEPTGAHAPETLQSLTENVLNAVLPDDDNSREPHPWSWLAELARARGLNVSADDLRALPYEVLFTENVRQWSGVAS